MSTCSIIKKYKEMSDEDLRKMYNQYLNFKNTGVLDECELRSDIMEIDGTNAISGFYMSSLVMTNILLEEFADRYFNELDKYESSIDFERDYLRSNL